MSTGDDMREEADETESEAGEKAEALRDAASERDEADEAEREAHETDD